MVSCCMTLCEFMLSYLHHPVMVYVQALSMIRVVIFVILSYREVSFSNFILSFVTSRDSRFAAISA
jgi:hypothetical protein